MAHKNKINAPPQQLSGRIRPSDGLCDGCPHDPNRPLFRFSTEIEVHSWFFDMPKKDQKAAIGTVKKMERMTWTQVHHDVGLKYREAKPDSLNHNVPAAVPPDCRLDYFKFAEGKRVFGYRVGAVFHIAWFDPNHESMDG